MSRNKKRKDYKIRKYEQSNRNRWLDYKITMHDSEIRASESANKEKILGPKMQILNAFKDSRNIEDAYKKACEINNRLNRNIYTKTMIKKWIKEEYGIEVQDEKINEDRNEEDDAR